MGKKIIIQSNGETIHIIENVIGFNLSQDIYEQADTVIEIFTNDALNGKEIAEGILKPSASAILKDNKLENVLIADTIHKDFLIEKREDYFFSIATNPPAADLFKLIETRKIEIKNKDIYKPREAIEELYQKEKAITDTGRIFKILDDAKFTFESNSFLNIEETIEIYAPIEPAIKDAEIITEEK